MCLRVGGIERLLVGKWYPPKQLLAIGRDRGDLGLASRVLMDLLCVFLGQGRPLKFVMLFCNLYVGYMFHRPEACHLVTGLGRDCGP